MSGRKRGRKRKYPVNINVRYSLSSSDDSSEPSESRERRDSHQQEVLLDSQESGHDRDPQLRGRTGIEHRVTCPP